jgi:ABC-type oligopeptide transport system substrate-binding subunit
MKRNWIYVLLAALLCVTLLLTACQPAGGGENKVVTFIFTQEPETLNLHYTNM